MALFNCPECGGQVSDKAAFCPHCGAPGKNVQARKGDWFERNYDKIMKLGITVPLSILGGLAIIAIVILFFIFNFAPK